MIDPSKLKPLILSELKPPMNITLVTPDSGLPELSRKERRRKTSLKYYRKNKTKDNLNSKVWRKKNPERAMWLRAKHHALKLGIPFLIKISDIVIPKKCPVLGISLTYEGSRDFVPSLDRRDSSLGYISENVFVISSRANRIKSDAALQEMESILKYMKGSNA
jgi:hypothetical protein